MRQQLRPILMIANVVVLVAVLVAVSMIVRTRPAAQQAPETISITRGQVHQLTLDDVRLGDGLPIQLTFAIQWEIENVEDFVDKYGDPSNYAGGVLHPKAHELAQAVTRTYNNSSAVFQSDRDAFTRKLKDTWRQGLGEKGISITDAFITDIAIAEIARDRVFQTTLTKVQLGDGVPVDLGITVRWRISDVQGFLQQFTDPDTYTTQVLQPKAHELARQVANIYKDVDEVFTTKRDQFVQALKQTWLDNLGETGVLVRDVSLQDVVLPKKYTEAMETVAMKEREIEQIRQQSIAELERSKAAEKKAAADGQVRIIQAQTAGRVSEIEAEAESKRRDSALAKAETEAQVKERDAAAEAKRSQLLAQAETERLRAVAQVDVEKTQSLKDLEVAQQRDMDALTAQREIALAELCTTNPAYATFLVNRELASKVQIAVLPVGTDTSVLGDLLKGAMKNE